MRWSKEHEARWQRLSDEVMTGIKEWRVQHPKATLREIEDALDERLARMRARMVQDLALTSAAAEFSTAVPEERPHCPQCGCTLEARGTDTRSLTTTYNQQITLTRGYAHCPICGSGLFPPG
ncbi:MAG: hypothetical protein EPO21_21780 [Chloroflexota bacterium]|nr:MAG: hypothetical protein EPO21_21780 [Chloroflexota bacterium]